MTDEQREQRIYHHLYVDSKSPLENVERITDLEELAADIWDWLAPTAVGGGAPLKELHDRMRKLGVEVPL